MAVTTTRADQYRQLARDFHLIAREERSAMLKMAEELDRLADQQEHGSSRADGDGDTHPRKGPAAVPTLQETHAGHARIMTPTGHTPTNIRP